MDVERNTTFVEPSGSKHHRPMLMSKLKKVFFGKFEDKQEEQLYQAYMRNQKLKIIPAFLVITNIYLVSRLALEAVVSDNLVHMTRVGIHAFFIVLTVIVLALLNWRPSMRKRASNMCVIALWMLVMSSLLVDVAVQSHPLIPSSLVGWVLVIIFTTFVVVPWKLRHCVGMSVSIATIHSLELFFLWFVRNHYLKQKKIKFHTRLVEELVADALLFVGAISLGILVFTFSDKKQRRSFLESKKSYLISYQIEKEHKEQKRLLQSVLPKYVARVMMRDIAAVAKSSNCQFRKMCIQHFDGVSILFADIVGFTAISSCVTAGELVKILNQLFANFDSLGHKYHQQRIKILGDCYYCVCGICKVEIRPDHAVLCIHMGMSMVDAISVVRRDTGKDVNMRVGIHTGSVMAGVMGQKQWQYDVLGQQVIMANHLESGGLPARVHISQTTKDQLEDQFQLEPGNGQDRDAYLRLENMCSYLVKGIIKKYPEGTLDANPALLSTLQAQAANECGMSTSENELESLHSVSSSDLMGELQGTYSHHYTLKDALFDKRINKTVMEKVSFFTMWFHDSATEDRYRQRREYFSCASMGALGLVLLLTSISKWIVLPRNLLTIVVAILGEIILILMALVSYLGVTKTKRIPPVLQTWCQFVDSNRLARMFWGITAIFVLIGADSATILQCDIEGAKALLLGMNVTKIQSLSHNNLVCNVPSYFVHVVNLILLAVSSMVQIELMTKLVLILFCATAYTVYCIFVFGPVFDINDAIAHLQGKAVPIKYDQSVQLITAALAILIINRKMEEMTRRLFILREEAEEKMEQAHEEHDKTEALIYNLLPEHVARYFIGQTRDHMDLYHHGYDNVAVMFAACPNFHDFYNESDINNQGLECLRLLHEIISDYDELMDKPCFKNTITKIKTVGPTYMAASGMVTPADRRASQIAYGTVSPYQHMDDLVQFALAMKEELRLINEQSFNSFLLRIGINHGPIIAGVIGVTKPHYDIWGNTVNVASRMESTGMPDHIQVAKETKDVLEEFGYYFQKRGLIKVKGKGELTTYFLMGQDKNAIKKRNSTTMNFSSPDMGEQAVQPPPDQSSSFQQPSSELSHSAVDRQVGSSVDITDPAPSGQAVVQVAHSQPQDSPVSPADLRASAGRSRKTTDSSERSSDSVSFVRLMLTTGSNFQQTWFKMVRRLTVSRHASSMPTAHSFSSRYYSSALHNFCSTPMLGASPSEKSVGQVRCDKSRDDSP